MISLEEDDSLYRGRTLKTTAYPEVQCRHAMVISNIDVGLPLQQQRHGIDVTSRHSQHQRRAAGKVWETVRDGRMEDDRSKAAKASRRKPTAAEKRNHSLPLRISSVHQVCTVRFIQQEAHTRRMTVHHWKGHKGLSTVR